MLFATAATLNDIKAAITDFYCGTLMDLVEAGENSWKVVRQSDGKELDGVIVTRKRGRYRFEAI